MYGPEVLANVPKTTQAFLSSHPDILVVDSGIEVRNTSCLLGLESDPLQENSDDKFVHLGSPLVTEREDQQRLIHYHLEEKFSICLL
ncbi:uncharacterized protein LOC118202126 isoform X2 [Stegodyphus dumicola]|uniref:uncharacterized protein LOC118202126 isoform X2 n=1 Tax=Stegodyphus dumicola TaxID=202533 RepID=UPI0015AE0F12|nr:uncharacterized protein LOC118202126 isoform X2 [Stegodyphus dumicola]